MTEGLGGGVREPGSVFDLIQNAQALHRRGALDDAERSYRQVLSRAPDHQGVMHALSVLNNQRGRFDQALVLLDAALAAGPTTAAIWNDYGIALAGLGRGEEAVEAYQRALALEPHGVEVANNLGEALRRLGRAEEALPLLAAAATAQPALAEVRANLAHCLSALERHEEALAEYKAVVALQPDHVAALRGQAASLARLDRREEAVEPLRLACAAAPEDAQLQCDLGHTLAALDRYAPAAQAYAAAVALAPDRAQPRLGLGQALIQLGRAAEAVASLDAALAIDPALADAHHSRGNALQILGRSVNAVEALRTAIALAPSRPGFHHSLAEAQRFQPNDARLAAMEALDIDSFDEQGRTALHFALAKAYDDLGRHGRAFRHLAQGNALKRASLDYKEAVTFAMFRRLARVFSADLMRQKAGLGDPSTAPVFIVGMPRSGTTLIEQVLASHPQVFGAGELPHLNASAGAMTWDDGRRAFPDIVPSLDGDALRRLGADYMDKVRPLAPDAARITDKMPENFPYVGLINLILPNARIIVARRDPLDICLSCHFKLFGGHQPHTYDLAELGRYYRVYDALMAHWRQVLPPGAMIEVQYEHLVADFEPQVRRILDHCGLDWDERCLSFHQTERPVRTASVVQVRRPLYSSSVGRWQPYRRLLGPLIEALGAP